MSRNEVHTPGVRVSSTAVLDGLTALRLVRIIGAPRGERQSGSANPRRVRGLGSGNGAYGISRPR